MLRGHLPRVIYHQAYQNTKIIPRLLANAQFKLVERLSDCKWFKPRPEYGLDWLICSQFAQQRVFQVKVFQVKALKNLL
jgi:hypothetical protein